MTFDELLKTLPDSIQDKIHSQQYEESAVELKTFIDANPNHPAAWHILGTIQAEVFKNFTDAEVSFRQQISIDPHHSQAWNGLGNVLRDLGRNEEAEKAYRKQLEVDPHHSEAWNGLGCVLRDLGRNEEAEKAFREQLKIVPRHSWAWNGLGNALSYLGRNEEAEEAYREQLEIDPRHSQAWNNLGNVLSNLGRNEEAEKAFREQLKIVPCHSGAWYNLGNVLSNLGRNEAAEKAYREQIIIVPRHSWAWYGLGYVLSDLGSNEEAEEAYREQLEIDPRHMQAWNGLGILLKDLGRNEEAEKAYREQIAIVPRHTYAWNNLGILLKDLGRYEEALTAFDEQIQIVPEHQSAWWNRFLLFKNENFVSQSAMEASRCLSILGAILTKTEKPHFPVVIDLIRILRQSGSELLEYRLLKRYTGDLPEFGYVERQLELAKKFAWLDSPDIPLFEKGLLNYLLGDIGMADQIFDELDTENLGGWAAQYYLALTQDLLNGDINTLLSFSLEMENDYEYLRSANSPQDLYYRARCHLAAGQSAEARSLIKEAFSRDEPLFHSTLFLWVELLLDGQESIPEEPKGAEIIQFITETIIPAEQERKINGKPYFLGLHFDQEILMLPWADAKFLVNYQENQLTIFAIEEYLSINEKKFNDSPQINADQILRLAQKYKTTKAKFEENKRRVDDEKIGEYVKNLQVELARVDTEFATVWAAHTERTLPNALTKRIGKYPPESMEKIILMGALEGKLSPRTAITLLVGNAILTRKNSSTARGILEILVDIPFDASTITLASDITVAMLILGIKFTTKIGLKTLLPGIVKRISSLNMNEENSFEKLFEIVSEVWTEKKVDFDLLDKYIKALSETNPQDMNNENS